MSLYLMSYDNITSMEMANFKVSDAEMVTFNSRTLRQSLNISEEWKQ